VKASESKQKQAKARESKQKQAKASESKQKGRASREGGVRAKAGERDTPLVGRALGGRRGGRRRRRRLGGLEPLRRLRASRAGLASGQGHKRFDSGIVRPANHAG